MGRTGANRAARLAVMSLAAAALANGVPTADAVSKKQWGTAGKFTLVSPDIGQGKTLSMDQVYKGFGCTGKNISPALFWSGAPAATKSFAIMVHDPDAPSGGFWHWVVYNIPAGVASIPADAGDPKKPGMPKGALEGRTDFGPPGYGGPCPPPGKPHHYHFMIFALKVEKIDVPADASPGMVRRYVNANKLAEAELVALYGQ